MKRKFLLTALCLASAAALTIGVTACGEKPDGHAHTYADKWSYDATYHYHSCTYDGCNSASGAVKHIYGEWQTVTAATVEAKGREKRECTVCDYVDYRDTDKLTVAPKHKHVWGKWTVTEANKPTESAEGKAIRTCTGTGDCDAEVTDKEYTLPNLKSTDYSKTVEEATCSAAGNVNYTYTNNIDGISVKFSVATPIDATAHNWAEKYSYEDGTGHYKVCLNNPEHKTGEAAHDMNEETDTCKVCGYRVPSDAALSTSSPTATVKVGGGKSARIDAYAFGSGYYTFTYEGDDPINVAYSYYVLGTGEVSGTTTLSWDGTRTFTARLSTKGTCWMTITSDKATAFNARIDMSFSDTDPTPAPKLKLNDTTEVNATFEGKRYEFTATKAGSYTLACTDVNAAIYLSADETTPLELPYAFTLSANQTITFIMSCKDIETPAATYNVTLNEVAE